MKPNLFCVGILFAVAATSANAGVNESSGNIVCDGKPITAGGMDAQPALSPDGHTVGFVHFPVHDQAQGVSATSELWLGDCITGTTRKLLSPRPTDEPKTNLTSFAWPTFSLNGRFVYVMVEGWVTSGAIHQVNLKTGSERFVTDGNSLEVIRTGPWGGYLIVQQHRYHDNGQGSYDPSYVVRPDGKEMFMVPASDKDDENDATATWLKKKGWTAW